MTALFPLGTWPSTVSLDPLLDRAREVLAPPAVIERTLLILRAGSIRQNTATTDSHTAVTESAPTASSHEPEIVPGGSDPVAVALSMEDLVREHADAVYRVALSVTRDPSLAEDASQDTLIKAWQSLPSYRGEAPLRHWILRIAHNVSISLLRKRREEIMAPFEMPVEATPQGGVESRVQERMAIGRFEEALGQLDGLSRSIVVLREVEGLSYAEISTVLEVPLPTVRTRILRARRQLAVALDGWQP